MFKNNSKTTWAGILGGVLTGFGDYVSTGQTITFRNVLTFLAFSVFGIVAGDAKRD